MLNTGYVNNFIMLLLYLHISKYIRMYIPNIYQLLLIIVVARAPSRLQYNIYTLY